MTPGKARHRSGTRTVFKRGGLLVISFCLCPLLCWALVAALVRLLVQGTWQTTVGAVVTALVFLPFITFAAQMFAEPIYLLDRRRFRFGLLRILGDPNRSTIELHMASVGRFAWLLSWQSSSRKLNRKRVILGITNGLLRLANEIQSGNLPKVTHVRVNAPAFGNALARAGFVPTKMSTFDNIKYNAIARVAAPLSIWAAKLMTTGLAAPSFPSFKTWTIGCDELVTRIEVLTAELTVLLQQVALLKAALR